MTQQPSSEVVVFVTHVEPDDIYLKIWGQMDKQAATAIEHYIYPLVEQFNQGYGCPSKGNRLIVGTLCCARFQTEGYYRAKILSVRPDGMIVIQFIDYGNIEVLPPNEVHLLDNIRGSDPLQAYPPMAAEFTLLNVLPVNGVWENRTIDGIRKILCYNEFRALIQMMNNRCLIKLWYKNEDFGELLVKERMALPATLQDMFRPKHSVQNRILQQMLPYQQQNKGNMNNFAAMPMMQSPNVNHNVNMQGLYHKTFSPDVQHKHAVQPILQHPPPTQHLPPPPVQEALVFKSRVLDVGSSHEVLISHVEDGPQKFSVQVESTRAILTCLMNDINNHPKQPLQEPPLPGSVCLGRYKDTSGDRVLCRAVVMSVMEHKCKLYYVDFGHTEVLPYTDIFQLPPEYINPKVLSIRFTLSGLKELSISQDMKEYFKDLVYRRLLILHVRPPEGPPLIQYGDLYDNGVNVKDLLKKGFPTPAAMIPITYSYPQLRQLTKDFQEVVHVSYVESCKKFYVQLDSGVKSLESIMAGLEQYAKTASTLNIAQLKAGLPCAALYDSSWYRAQILGIVGDKVKVVYVDYGNEEVLPVISLRTIHDDLVTKLPAQAIKCALNGYEVLSLDQEVSNHFERLTLEKRFYMKVVAAQPNGLLVDLFEFDTMRSVHPQLLNNLFCDKTENSTTSSRNEEVQHPVKTMNEFQSEDKDKYGKKSNVDSWNRNQNTRPFQDNKSSTWKGEWSQERQYDNKRERTGSYSQRDGSQNDRFIKDKAANNRFNRDKSYNKYDEGDANGSNRSNRFPRDNGNRFPRDNGNERRYRNNSSDKANSDKDSDTSSKDNDRRRKGGFKRDGFNDSRGGSRDGGTSGRFQTTNWNDKKATPYKANYRNEKFNGDYDGGNKFRNKEDNINNVYDQTIDGESWGTNDANKELPNNITADGKSQLSLMKIDITLNSVKNCEVVFINGPSDFFVQLSPDCLELDSIMESIAATYENGGEIMQASEIQSGTYCIAQYSDDLKWYRAIIKSVEGNSAIVEFVDYGNTESVDLMNIKVILEEFLKLPMQAVHCKLLGLTNTSDEQHAIFLEKAEGKPLQVEFVSEENGIYEVLLCEVVDGVPNTNSINEEFCTIADLTKVKQAAATSKKTFETITESRTATDNAPLDSKWETILYDPESKQDVVVTWFINPNKLYCQLLSKETEFKTMMSEIQKTYAGRKSVTHKLQIGSAVIAIFSEDRALYRAEVVNIDTRKDAYVVQYIDFGNCAIVDQYNIYSVEKKFMHLPRLAVQCSLKDIVPNNSNSNWSEVDSNALDNCFSADKYECIFHSFNDDQYVISLNHDGQDVSNILVQKNLAVFTTKPSIETISAAETHDSEVKELNVIERVDISLLSGQTLKMRVSNVKNTTQFYVQLPSASKCENIVDQYMANKDTKVMPRLSTRELCLDAGCLVNTNGTWKRAVVINCTRSVGFDVKFIDTGTYDEILNDALALPGELAVMQNQALECSLQDVPASSDVDKQLKELEGKEALVYVEEVNNSRLIVKLYDLSGNGIMNTEEKIPPVCPMPILSSTHKVSVSYADHSTNIWLQRYSDVDIETKLSEDLQQYYTNSGQRLEPEVHLLCATKYSDDGQWYRGRIVSLTERMAYVNYIDYGNTEEVALDSIMILEPQFYEPHQLAINVSLSVSFIGTEAEQKDILQTHLMNKDFSAVFYNVHKKWIVDLIENEEKLSDRFRSLNLVKIEQTACEPTSEIHIETTTPGRFDVCVSHVDSPSQFWLQRMDKIASLDEKQEQLQAEVIDFVAIDGIPEEGTLCVASYSIDDLWYRAEVLDADEDITTVRFIDYGNTDVIDNKASSVRQMPDAWKNLETFALKCRLDVIPVDTEDWSESTCERFRNLVTSEESLQALVVADTMPKRVELFINDKSVSETLVEEKHAIIISTEQEPVDEIVDLELDPHSAFVCHNNSPSEFWVQEEKSVADLEVMADRFMVADMFPKIDEIKEGLLCVAKYPEDEQWYRARVISHDENGTQVIYIDYGNSAVSTEICAIPEDVANIPPLSRKCCLELPSQVEEWSEQAREEFVKLAAEGATIFLLDVLKDQETSLVKLTLDGQNVADILGSMCERISPVIEERLPPLGEENSPNVMVSYVNSPSEFWIQAESSISELEVMSDRLRDADSFLTLKTLDVGTVCAARYPEDGDWYRAKIIALCEEGTGAEVLYMDYGNSAVTEDLRVLPEDIVNIPTLSKRCTLETDIVTWSKQACDKFKELAAEGATMFQFETLNENDPMLVRLSLNETNVIDLLSECENVPKMEEVTETEVENTAIDTEKQQETVLHESQPINDSPNVMVSYVNSPSEFWIQAESSISELEVMSDRLRDADSFLTLKTLDVGTVCAARYPEDGDWYRAKIIALCEEGTGAKVLYMDYGNSAVTEDLRVLPEDIVNISTLSKRCTLETDIVTWSEQACDKFKELVAEGATMFQFETLNENDPMLVRLSLNGTNVIDLLSECENVPKMEEVTETEVENTAIDTEKQQEIVLHESQPINEKQQETVLHENQQVNEDEETSNLSKIAQLDCVDQMEKLEINEAVFNGIGNSDINEECESSEAQQIKENIDDTCEIVAEIIDDTCEIVAEILAECTSRVRENISATETNKDVVINETISSASTSIEPCLKASSSIITELSVDEIIENMIRDATDDLETQKVDANSSNENETQQNAQTEGNEQQELLSQMQSIDISQSSDVQILETINTETDIEKSIKILSITTEPQPQDVQLDASQDKEEEVRDKMESDADESSKCEILEIVSSLPKEQINLEQIQRQSPPTYETIPESTYKNGLETQSENTDMSNDSSSGSTCLAKSSPVIKTDPIERCSHSEKRSEDKDVLKRVSEGESSNTETKRSVTPKTSHSEKIVAAVVNPYVQPVLDSTNENDEVLSISVEDNIPKYAV
ncbi:protein tudor isoform X1 [Temnothorax nylanderi]|uniref:protein tudor isoform X1 n=1 Tax=Temnothorax nylanderi TaxID=102681 RepID=UPI003A89C375